ncbi:hypothetical protein THAOC_33822 [Thalassiosira oceanica]|uniref:MORN repeat-containing protein 5 n=1 Tax=Thalassiosira oceanica TaxID=159749 RepID=K0RL75_THAOC|nr:hypothetical protein THAOC_33822 [Thalassiosira oceanica]|eukprot:EJK47452.1 hypothetical protein THAOC_33822 [Thalassiosira oceanica]
MFDPYLGCGLPLVQVAALTDFYFWVDVLFAKFGTPPRRRARPPSRRPKPAVPQQLFCPSPLLLHHQARAIWTDIRATPSSRAQRTRRRRTTASTRGLPRLQTLRRQPGLPPCPVEVEVAQADSGSQRKSTSSTDAPRRSGRRSLNAGSRSVEHSTAGSSGGGGSIRDSAHDRPRGDEIRTGESYFNIRGSRARGDEEDGPPRQKRKVERTYADGSSYNGFVSDGKRDGQGTLTRPGGVREEGVFVNDELIKGTATNMKLKNGARYTGQIAGGVPNGTGTVISAEFTEHGIFVDGFLHGPGKRTFPRGEEEGNFVNGKLDNGTTTYSFFHGGHCIGQIAGGAPNEAGTMTFADSREKGIFVNGKLSGQGHKSLGIGWENGVYVNGMLHGRGARWLEGGLSEEGEFVNGILHGQGKKRKDRWGMEEDEFANGRLNGQGKRKITHRRTTYHEFAFRSKEKIHHLDKTVLEEGIIVDGVDGILDTGTVENIELWNDVTWYLLYYTGQIVGVHEGVFDVGGLREGKITFLREGKNGEVKIEGVFVDVRLNGHGKFTYADGEVLEGDFVNGCLNGHGKLTYDDGGNGNIYMGEIVDGHRLGLGYLSLPTKCLGPTVADPIISVIRGTITSFKPKLYRQKRDPLPPHPRPSFDFTRPVTLARFQTTQSRIVRCVLRIPALERV